MEYFDVYDKNGVKTGEVLPRNIRCSADRYFLAVTVVAQSGENILLTKRDEKKSFGGFWEFTGGGVQSGENSLEAAVRELREETGLSFPSEAFGFWGHVVFEEYHMHLDVYQVCRPFTEEQIVLQPGETVDFCIIPLKMLDQWQSRLTPMDRQLSVIMGLI